MNHMVLNLRKPAFDEYPPVFKRYINAAGDCEIIKLLRNGKEEMIHFLETIGWEKWEQPYAPGKWTLAELLVHLIDFERIFTYRALRIARNDITQMAGFEQDDLAKFSGATERLPASIVREYEAVREATIQLFENFTNEMWSRKGMAGGYTFSPLAIAFIIAGHELHHRKMIEEHYL